MVASALLLVVLSWRWLGAIIGAAFFISLIWASGLSFPSDRTVRNSWEAKQPVFEEVIAMLVADNAFNHSSSDCRFNPHDPNLNLGLKLTDERRAQYERLLGRIPNLVQVCVYTKPSQAIFVLGTRGLAINWGGLKGISYLPTPAGPPYSQIVPTTDGLRDPEEGRESLVPLQPHWYVFLW
jgi:hypothetical protein